MTHIPKFKDFHDTTLFLETLFMIEKNLLQIKDREFFIQKIIEYSKIRLEYENETGEDEMLPV